MSFAPNVKCLAYHGPLLYEAKILKVYEPKTKKIITKEGEKSLDNAIIPEPLLNERAFFIHYKGWKASWDEWVGKERMLELNHENIRLQKSLKDAVLQEVKEGEQREKRELAKSMEQANADTTEHSETHRNKRKRTFEEVEKSEQNSKKPEIHLNLPASLKEILVNDWEYITKNHQLVPLPKSPTVNEILKEFKSYYLSRNSKNSITDKDILDEFLSGLKVYFNNALGHILLYRFERQQYKNILHSKSSSQLQPCEIYGCEHLLRLFVSLPGLISQTNMDQQSIDILKDRAESLISFIAANKDDYVSTKYDNTSPAYDAASCN